MLGQPPMDLAQRGLHGYHLVQSLLAVHAGLNHSGDGMQVSLSTAQAAYEVCPELKWSASAVRHRLTPPPGG